MFILVRLYADQTDADADIVRRHRLLYFGIRRVAEQRQRLSGRDGRTQQRTLTPLVLLPLSVVLRAVRVFPLEWPRAPRSSAELEEVASCGRAAKVIPVLVFWPPTRKTFLPMTCLPLDAEGGDEENGGAGGSAAEDEEE